MSEIALVKSEFFNGDDELSIIETEDDLLSVCSVKDEVEKAIAALDALYEELERIKNEIEEKEEAAIRAYNF